MNAVRIDSYKAAPRLVEVPDPSPAPGQIVVAIEAAGVGIWDAMTRDGQFPTGTNPPLTLGVEGAGTVRAVAGDVSELHPGDRVYFYTRQFPNGAYAQALAMPAGDASRMPQELDFVQAAALPVAAITALMALEEAARLSMGQVILITGAAGGVGTLAVQMAKRIGATVVTTGSGANETYVRNLGADEFIDYTKGDYVAAVRAAHPQGVDAVLECAAKANGSRSLEALRPGGVFVDLVYATIEPSDASIRVAHVGSQPGRARLERIAQMVDAGALTVEIDRTFPLAQAAEALAYVEGGHTRGKVVLTTA